MVQYLKAPLDTSFAALLAGAERMVAYVHVINRPDARVMVDTGRTELHPAVADLDPRLRPRNI